ncbi:MULTISPECIES: NUDIX domain-containing protein [Clostridium]|uniref:NAD(+) diphosphatase n=1 Tax=Clostridium cibarium TaxID=2762247 RepID=A0ABR8PUH1_9CLOT|nr:MULTISPECIES: NUDIX domain-containing protein [Clostridium]MBD7911823.1 NUDIX domain-containing protein [Clostridium cibarium]
MKFKFCPICGRKLGEMFCGDEGRIPYCEYDNELFFDTPKPCIMVAVIKDDEILLLKQSYIYKDSKVLVSGYIGIDEKAEDTVYREVLEETSIEIQNVEFLGTDYIEGKELLMLTYLASYKAGVLSKSKEVEEASWVKISDALEHMKENLIGQRVIKKVLDRRKMY